MSIRSRGADNAHFEVLNAKYRFPAFYHQNLDLGQEIMLSLQMEGWSFTKKTVLSVTI